MTHSRLISTIVVLGATVGLVSCAQDAGSPGTKASTEKPARHAVSNDQLRTAMRDLNRRSSEDVAAELYSGNYGGSAQAGSGNLGRVADAAAAIAKTAKHIPDALTGSDLSESDRQSFVQLAERLGNEAQAVQQAALQGDATKVRAATEHMNGTCNACHSSFRLTK